MWFRLNQFDNGTGIDRCLLIKFYFAAVWTGIILALLLAISLATGMGTEAFRTLPVWLGRWL